MAIIVRAELRARPGRRDEFRDLARHLADAAATEPLTLRYEWFAGPDPDVFVVLEEYADPAAALAHNEACAALLARVPELAEMVSVHLHGELGPLQEWVDATPVATSYPPLT